jgi:superfamily II DNA or RNA helicase
LQDRVPAPGDVVWIRARRWRVERARRDHDVVRLDVAGRAGRCTFLAPFDRPRAIAPGRRPIAVRPRSAAARLAGIIARHAQHDWELASAVDARIHILPYQLEPALAMLRRSRRVLLADSVGLGKTIQAGLVVAELQRREPALRALIVVPSALRRQWRDELRAHFAIDATAADATALQEIARASPRSWTPWEGAGVWIASIDYLKQPHVLRDAARRVWDLLVVDEAHGVCGDSERHAAADVLARVARRVLLLSATPHSGREPGFQRLLHLGALPREDDGMRVFRRTRADVDMTSDRRVRWHRVVLSIDETRALDALADFERVAASRGARPEGRLLVSVFRKRALSTMTALVRSVERRMGWLDARLLGACDSWAQGRLVFEDADDDMSGDERSALTADIGLSDTVERTWLRRIRAIAARAAPGDSRIRRVLTFVRRAREPVAVFTEFRDSLAVLHSRLSTSRATSVLHGALPLDEQQRQIDRFLSGGSIVLLATDVASQGLNLQSACRCVLNLELPWNPARLEQRAGRVDRIGQRRRVHVGLFAARHAAEDDLRARLDARARDAAAGINQTEVRLKPDTTTVVARLAARRIGERRRLARHWRGPAAGGRPFIAALDALPFLKRLASGQPLFVFSIAFLDGTGDVIERHLVCVRGPRWRALDPLVIAAARASVTQRLAARRRRLRVSRQREETRWSTIDRAIAAGMLARAATGEVQPGLFDRRALAEAAAAVTDLVEIESWLAHRLAALKDAACVTDSAPVLLAILHPSW